MGEKKYPKDKPSKHATIRIPKAMADAVEEFLKTDLAKRMGYLYKIDVITAATRQLLEKYGFYDLPEEEAEASRCMLDRGCSKTMKSPA